MKTVKTRSLEQETIDLDPLLQVQERRKKESLLHIRSEERPSRENNLKD